MGGFYAVILVISILVIWGYLSFTPKWVNRQAAWAYNWATLLTAGLMSIAYVLNIRTDLIKRMSTADLDPQGAAEAAEAFAYWPVIALLGALGLSGIVLFIAFLVRNYLIFRPTRMKGRW